MGIILKTYIPYHLKINCQRTNCVYHDPIIIVQIQAKGTQSKGITIGLKMQETSKMTRKKWLTSVIRNIDENTCKRNLDVLIDVET